LIKFWLHWSRSLPVVRFPPAFASVQPFCIESDLFFHSFHLPPVAASPETARPAREPCVKATLQSSTNPTVSVFAAPYLFNPSLIGPVGHAILTYRRTCSAFGIRFTFGIALRGKRQSFAFPAYNGSRGTFYLTPFKTIASHNASPPPA